MLPWCAMKTSLRDHILRSQQQETKEHLHQKAIFIVDFMSEYQFLFGSYRAAIPIHQQTIIIFCEWRIIWKVKNCLKIFSSFIVWSYWLLCTFRLQLCCRHQFFHPTWQVAQEACLNKKKNLGDFVFVLSLLSIQRKPWDYLSCNLFDSHIWYNGNGHWMQLVTWS